MLDWFAETAIVAALLAALAAAAGRFGRLRPASRHALWVVVLVRLLTPPLLQWPWATPLTPRADPEPGDSIAEAVTISEVSSIEAFNALEVREVAPITDPRPTAPGPIDPGRPATASKVDVGSRLDAESSQPGRPIPWRGILLALWLVGSIAIAAVQGLRIVRFARRLRSARPAPSALIEEVAEHCTAVGLRPIRVMVVPRLGTPLLWCAGRVRLLVPEGLLEGFGPARRRCVIAHELAHLARGDHWVSRLELIAGWFWWWNPIYWWVRSRLSVEAEHACDAWVVRRYPNDRRAFAEALLDVCQRSIVSTPPPAIGISGGSPTLLERRLRMILREPVRPPLPRLALLGTMLLALLALPAWSRQAPDGTSDSSTGADSISPAIPPFDRSEEADDPDPGRTAPDNPDAAVAEATAGDPIVEKIAERSVSLALGIINGGVLRGMNSELLRGQYPEFNVKVRNTGAATLRHLKFLATFTGGLRSLDEADGDELWTRFEEEIPDLDPGEEFRVPSMRLMADGMGPQRYTFEVSGLDGEPVLSTATGIVCIVAPDLYVDVDGPSQQSVGSTAEYVVTVINTGSADARDVSVGVFVPMGATPTVPGDARSDTDFEKGLHKIHWRLERLDKDGGMQQFRLPVTFEKIQPYTFKAAANAQGPHERGPRSDTSRGQCFTLISQTGGERDADDAEGPASSPADPKRAADLRADATARATFGADHWAATPGLSYATGDQRFYLYGGEAEHKGGGRYLLTPAAMICRAGGNLEPIAIMAGGGDVTISERDGPPTANATEPTVMTADHAEVVFDRPLSKESIEANEYPSLVRVEFEGGVTLSDKRLNITCDHLSLDLSERAGPPPAVEPKVPSGGEAGDKPPHIK